MKVIEYLSVLPAKLTENQQQALTVLNKATGDKPVVKVDLQGLHRGVAKRAFHVAAKIRGGKVRFRDDGETLLVKFESSRKAR